MSQFNRFDRKRLSLRPLAERENLLDLSSLLSPADCSRIEPAVEYRELAGRILEARRAGAPVVLFLGAHLLRAGAAPLIISLMELGYLTHLGMNGAGPIHDFEMALIGQTTESVSRYIAEGQFGLWKETGRINEIVENGVARGIGFGESVGEAIEIGDYPNRTVSVLGAGFRLGIPVTVHIGIGYDIIHEHPNCNAAALGAASYTDFLIFAETVSHLEGGVFLNFGSAVMGPEVYLKALAMARNVARQEGRCIKDFTTAVFDIVPLGEETDREPERSDPRYYFRPFKTILVRTVQDGGRSRYFRGPHRETFAALYKAVRDQSDEG